MLAREKNACEEFLWDSILRSMRSAVEESSVSRGGDRRILAKESQSRGGDQAVEQVDPFQNHSRVSAHCLPYFAWLRQI